MKAIASIALLILPLLFSGACAQKGDDRIPAVTYAYGPLRVVFDDGQTAGIAMPQNAASKIDGTGLNVTACVQALATAHNVAALDGFFEWSKSEPGGSWREKLDRQIAEFCTRKERVQPKYTHLDDADLETVEKLAKDGPLMFADHGNRKMYRLKVNCASVLVCVRGDQFFVVDPNFPEAVQVVSRESFKDRLQGWVFYFGKR